MDRVQISVLTCASRSTEKKGKSTAVECQTLLPACLPAYPMLFPADSLLLVFWNPRLPSLLPLRCESVTHESCCCGGAAPCQPPELQQHVIRSALQRLLLLLLLCFLDGQEQLQGGRREHARGCIGIACHAALVTSGGPPMPCRHRICPPRVALLPTNPLIKGCSPPTPACGRFAHLELGRQLGLRIEAVGEVDAAQAAVSVDLHSQRLHVIGAVGALHKVGQVELHLQ